MARPRRRIRGWPRQRPPFCRFDARLQPLDGARLFSALPLIIGAAGFSFPAALLGSLAGAALLSSAAQLPFGLGYFLGFGAPALILAALLQVSLPSRDPSSPAPRFAAPGELLAAIVVLAIAIAGLGVAVLVPSLSWLRGRT